MEEKGILYLCATPIGNLEDITLRAIRVLGEVDMIAAEDTRHTLRLLNHFNISKPLISYHEHNKGEKGAHIVKQLKLGKNIALVTDAGTPGISDPGEDLVRLCAENYIKVTALPGAVAGIAALILSGLFTGKFAFEGFLPANKSSRQERLKNLANDTRTLIFYEAPHKLKRTLDDMQSIFGNRKITIARELTKKFEEIIRCSIDQAVIKYSVDNPKGEFVLIVEGMAQNKIDEVEHEKWKELSINKHIDMYASQGFDSKEAMKLVAKDRGLSKRDIYSASLSEKE